MRVNGEKHTTKVTIEVCGLERTVTVDFTVYSYGSSDTWHEPGDPPEFEINDVTDLSGPGQYAKYASMRDLSRKTTLVYPHSRTWYDHEGAHFDLGEPQRVLAYGYGFEFAYYGGPLEYNKGRSLIDAMEQDILNRINDFESYFDD